MFETFETTEAATRGILCKEMILEISQNSQENTVPESLFNKVAGRRGLYWKKTEAQVFSSEFVKFLRTPFLLNTSGWLLLIQ